MVWASHGFATPAARWKVLTLETYRRTVAGALVAAMASMKAATVSGDAGRWQRLLLGAPAGEDRHVSAQGAFRVASIGTTGRLGMLPQIVGDLPGRSCIPNYGNCVHLAFPHA